MKVHLSIHDVCPRWESEVETILSWAHGYGLRPALLVVPNFHGDSPLVSAGRFCEKLRALQRGDDHGPHEVYLHGFFHRAEKPADAPPRGMSLGTTRWDRFRSEARSAYYQRFVSAGEAEFASLARERARDLVIQGRQVLEAAGLRVDGFVAPAWSMPDWLHSVLADQGIRFTEDHLRVYDPVAGRSRFTVLINYATRTRLRLVTTAAFGRVGRVAAPLAPLRIAIHPADLSSALIQREILGLFAWAAAKVVVSGPELLDKKASAGL